MGLFQLQSNQVIIDPNILVIPEFKKIWDSDKTKTKDTAYKALSYVYFMADFESPYGNGPSQQRHNTIVDDFIREKDWKPTKDIEAAISKYKALTETPAMRLVYATREALDKMCIYIRETEADSRSIKVIMDTVKRVGDTLAAHMKLEDLARKESKQSSRMLGNRETGAYER